ncbi:MAG TPA: hypothetical protein VGR01_02515 [Burkholderiales bacterium]|jgi:PAS domain-containing protein|nr:hypothetical protein [Burkholderiales bacterium]
MSRNTVLDISQLKDAERALQEANAFLDTIVENIPSMIFVKVAAKLRSVRINRLKETLLGIPRNALLGKNDHELFPAEQADFSPRRIVKFWQVTGPWISPKSG